MRLPPLLLAAALGGLALSSAPARAESVALLPEAPSVPGGHVGFRITGEPSTLDWNIARTSAETYLIMNLMEGLVEEGPDLKPRPALAERWEISDDGLTYVFYLRPGVKWSDGKPLKAADFEESWIRLLNPRTKAGYANFLFDVENAEAYHEGKLKNRALVGVKAIGDSKLQVKLRQRVPYFLHLPGFWLTFPIRADLVAKHPRDWTDPGKMVVLGPYRLKEWKKGKLIRLERNPMYFGPAPPVAAVDAVVEPDDRKARAMFERGELDFLLNATTEDLLKARAQGESAGVRVQQYPYLATYYLGFNVRSPAVGDVSIRRAIAMALILDRDKIPSVLQGGQRAASCWIPEEMAGFHSEAHLTGTLYDAKGLMTQAGYVEGKGFPKLRIWIEKFDGAQVMADFLGKTMQEKLGISLDAHIDSPAAYQKAMASGQADLFLTHWGADFPDPANFLEVFATGSGTNDTHWSSKEYDAFLEKGRAAAGAPERLAAYAEAERLLLEKDVAIVPLFYKRNTVLLGGRIKELSISPLNYLFMKDVRLR